jgi:SNF family Na+-dependent transporter
MDNSDIFWLFVLLFLGLLCMVEFRQLTKFLLGEAKGSKSTWSREWEPRFTQIFIFVMGIIFFVLSLSELLPLIFK